MRQQINISHRSYVAYQNYVSHKKTNFVATIDYVTKYVFYCTEKEYMLTETID